MGTFGRLTLGDHAWFTVERQWVGNKPSVSCIPAGTYPLVRGTFYSGDGVGGKPDYPAYELQNVPGRALIKIHRANLAYQVKGCIAVGKELGAEGGLWAVLRSREAHDELMRAPTVEAITIRWATVEPA
jgi:hypothetical protein